MPREPVSDTVLRAKRLGRVAVLGTDGQVLAPCHPARARALVHRGRARLIQRDPAVIRLQVPGPA
ncbi:RRXRR domain-containing protein [Thiococcus pfennigii]|uniref:RRXRR domain-containing protein n=1 Tax=Thiococcus pfennigii TaxID=1057 RepID=UPI001904C212|nr:RRXRR domain-containing protein [Thiococcus pfennigii]MBK1700212.1 hypothetical protein [Thiococcus pfennigii]